MRALSKILVLMILSTSIQCGNGLLLAPSSTSGSNPGPTPDPDYPPEPVTRIDGTGAVTSISPSSGARGTTLTITGTNFSTGATVKLDNTLCSEISVVSSTEIRCVVPRMAAASPDVSVRDSSGNLIGTLTNAFTVKQFFLVANQSSYSAILRLSPTTGALSLVAESTSIVAASFAVHPSKSWIYFYSLSTGTKSLGLIDVNPEDGTYTINSSSLRDFGTEVKLVISPDGTFLLVVSKSTDQVHLFSINQTSGALTSIDSVAIAGSPQLTQAVFSGGFIYLSGEVSASLYSYAYSSSGFTIAPVYALDFAVKRMAQDSTRDTLFLAEINGSLVSYTGANAGSLVQFPGVPLPLSNIPDGLAPSHSRTFFFIPLKSVGQIDAVDVTSTSASLRSGSPFSVGFPTADGALDYGDSYMVIPQQASGPSVVSVPLNSNGTFGSSVSGPSLGTTITQTLDF